jgi:hypothetical protein
MKDIEKQRMANKVKYKGPAKNGGEWVERWCNC